MLVLLLLNLLPRIMMRMIILQLLLLLIHLLPNLVKMMMMIAIILTWIFLHSVESVECILRVCYEIIMFMIPSISLVDLTSLVQTIFGNNTFPNTTAISFVEMPSVEDITMEEGSLGKASELNINSKLQMN